MHFYRIIKTPFRGSWKVFKGKVVLKNLQENILVKIVFFKVSGIESATLFLKKTFFKSVFWGIFKKLSE